MKSKKNVLNRAFKSLLIVLLSSIVSSFSMADAFSSADGKMLIQSCREAVKLFENRDEPSILSGFTTSLSEAMRAGYCIGMIEQYLSMTGNCNGFVTSWKPVAELIAKQNENSFPRSSQRLLEFAACD